LTLIFGFSSCYEVIPVSIKGGGGTPKYIKSTGFKESENQKYKLLVREIVRGEIGDKDCCNKMDYVSIELDGEKDALFLL